ncbi:MAG: PAS domain-containing sensor histidine kinase [Cyanobacteria bacterium P01_F01_bin.13]
MKRFNSIYTPPGTVLAILLLAAILFPVVERNAAIRKRAQNKAFDAGRIQHFVESQRKFPASPTEKDNLAQATLDTEYPDTFALLIRHDSEGRVSPIRLKPYRGQSENLHLKSIAGEKVEWADLIKAHPELEIAKQLHEESRDQEYYSDYAHDGNLFTYKRQRYQIVARPVSANYSHEVWLVTNLSASTKDEYYQGLLDLTIVGLAIFVIKIFQTVQTSYPVFSLRRQIEAGKSLRLPAIAANEIKALAKSFEESQELLKKVINLIPKTLIFLKDENHVYRLVNSQMGEVSGLGDDLVGKTDFDAAWTEAETKNYIKDDKYVLENGSKFGILELQTQSDGAEIWLSTSKLLIYIGGEPYLLGVAQDVSELVKQRERAERLREQAEEQQKKLEYQLKFLQTVADAASPDIIMWAKGENHEFVFVNQALVDVAFGELGHSPGEMIGKTAIGQGWWADAEEYKFWKDDDHVITTGQKLRDDEVMGHDEQGRVRTQRVIKVPDDPENPTVAIGVAFITTDLTEATRKVEKLLAESEQQRKQIDLVNHLVAHDALATIKGSRKTLQFVSRSLNQMLAAEPENTRLAKVAPRIERIVVSLGIVNDLLSERNKMLNLESELSRDTIMIADLVADIQKVSDRSGLTIDNQCPAEVTCVADPTYLKRVLINLIENAFAHNKNASPTVDFVISNKDSVVSFIIKDNGIGMTQESIDKIGLLPGKAGQFNPDSKGSGLGWFTIRQTLEAMKFPFKITSELGKGTTITIVTTHE